MKNRLELGRRKAAMVPLPKAATGIQGLDEITHGGFPKGRPSLVCGSAGSGKTLLAMEFLVRGALQFDEPGVFVSFEEDIKDLIENVASLGFDLDALIANRKLVIDYVRVQESEIKEAGAYDLEGLFIRLNYAIDSIGATRVVLDTIETLFSGLSNHHLLRGELRRLFGWLKEKGVTTIITCEKGDGTLTRHGLEEYVADCVVALDHRVTEQISTRRIRVVKYRGSEHGTNEYPFLIDETGFSVFPNNSIGLNHVASDERVVSGIPRLDAMLGGQGYYRGSSVLISGTAGTGKTTVAVHLVSEACKRGERCLYLASEESEAQIIRNARSIGIDLAPFVDNGLLHFNVARPTDSGLEMHLSVVNKLIGDFQPSIVVIDPITGLTDLGSREEVKSMLIRLVDLLKNSKITTLYTSLTNGSSALDPVEASVTSLMDTWLLVRDLEHSGERTRGLYVLKSRGMAHSNQIREFLITSRGIELADVYIGQGMVLTGSARKIQEIKESAEATVRKEDMDRVKRQLERKRSAMEAKIKEIQEDFISAEEELLAEVVVREQNEKILAADCVVMADARKADAVKLVVRQRPVKAKVA